MMANRTRICAGARFNLTRINATLCNMTRPDRPPKPGPGLAACYKCHTPCVLRAIELVYTIGVVANILVILRVIIDKKLRKPTFVAIACLAISDTMFVVTELVLVIEFVANRLTTCPTLESQIQGIPYKLVSGACWFAANGNLTLLAVVRFLLIVYPLKAYIYLTTKKVIISSICIWIIGLTIYAGVFIYDKTQGRRDALSPEKTTVVWTIVYLVPLAITCILHLVKLRLVRNTTRDTENKQINKNVNRMTSIILFVIFAAFVFPLPKFVFDILERSKYKFPSRVNKALFGNISKVLFYLNNTLNPFVYALFSSPFRHSVRSMFRCKNNQNTNDEPFYGAFEDTPYSLTSFYTDSPITSRRSDTQENETSTTITPAEASNDET